MNLGDYVEISVSDNGPGFPAESAARLFDKFTRGQAESAVPGVGLGLAISRAIVDAHRGTIRAENLTPHGARFVISLPAATPPVMDDHVPRA
jgi:two-component system sensor histidine kinase KdpD